VALILASLSSKAYTTQAAQGRPDPPTRGDANTRWNAEVPESCQVQVLPSSGPKVLKVRSDGSNNLHHSVKYAVKNHVVTLTSEVDSQSKRARAGKVASAVLNVQEVVNELQVKGQKATSTK
jgi:osmotically-inducible protein OsmY